MNYNLKQPCSNCPFRRDKFFPLHPDRVREIIEDGAEFACHKTVDYEDESGDGFTEKTEHCAGVLILLEKQNQPHQMMRISERLGLYDRHSLKMDAPVYDHVEDYIELIESKS